MTMRRDQKRDDEVGEGLKAYTLTEPLDLEALTQALDGVPVVAEGLADASSKRPGTLWVSGDLDPNAVRRAATASQEVEAPDQAVGEMERLRAKVRDGQTLTPDEVQTALRLILTEGA